MLVNHKETIFRKLKKIINQPHSLFLLVGIIFGGIFIVITPPLQGPDEQSHFLQTYMITEGNFINNPDDTYPVSLKSTYKTVFYNDDIRFKPTEKYESYRTKDALSIKLSPSIRETSSGYLQRTNYAPTNYIPQSIMVFLGKLFGLSPVLLTYLARIGGLVVWLLMVYFAIKITPIGKWAFFVVAILPVSMFQAAVVSADTLSFALLFVFLALIIKITTSNKENTKLQITILSIITILLSLTKFIMILFIPLIFLIIIKNKTNKSFFKNLDYKHLLWILPTLFISALFAKKWSVLSAGSVSSEGVPNGVNPGIQISNIFHHPTEFIYAFWNTNFFTWGDNMVRSTIGNFGWSDTPMSLSFLVLGYIIVFIALTGNRGSDFELLKNNLRKITRLASSVLALIFFLLVCLALYIYYTPVNFNIIVGLQGRYFYPIFIIMVVVFINNNQLVLKLKAYNSIVKLAPILLLMVSCLYVYIRYYVNTSI